MKFDEALQIASKAVRQACVQGDIELRQFERSKDFDFRFTTTMGDYEVSIDSNGNLVRLNQVGKKNVQTSSRSEMPTRRSGAIDEKRATELALSNVGSGKVVDIRREADGYEIVVSKGIGRKVNVSVSDKGEVTVQKKPGLGEMLDLDF